MGITSARDRFEGRGVPPAVTPPWVPASAGTTKRDEVFGLLGQILADLVC